jgi:hypothetical protein
LRRCAILRHWFKHNGECVGNLRDLQARAARPKGSAFKACEPGSIHVDVKYLPQMADGAADRKTVRLRAKAIDPGDQLTCEAVFPPNARRYLFVAIDRATRLGSSSASSRPGPRPMHDPRHRA